MKIGWSLLAEEGGICFPAPARFVPQKDQSRDGKGFLNCPAVRGYFSGTYIVTAPFSIQLRHSLVNGQPVIQPVYPFTSLTEQKVQELIKIEPRSTWRSPDVVVLQMPSPYLFFADQPVVLRQDPCLLTTPTSLSWRQIPGKFNIYDWQRPLNWACEWFVSAGDLIIKAGEPLYFVSFESVHGESVASVDLVQQSLTPELRERLALSRNIVSMRKGVVPLISKAGELRNGQIFIEEEQP